MLTTTPAKPFHLKLATEVIRELKNEQHHNGVNYSPKAIMACSVTLNLNVTKINMVFIQ